MQLKWRPLAQGADQRLPHATGNAEHDQRLTGNTQTGSLLDRACEEFFDAVEKSLLFRMVAALLE